MSPAVVSLQRWQPRPRSQGRVRGRQRRRDSPTPSRGVKRNPLASTMTRGLGTACREACWAMCGLLRVSRTGMRPSDVLGQGSHQRNKRSVLLTHQPQLHSMAWGPGLRGYSHGAGHPQGSQVTSQDTRLCPTSVSTFFYNVITKWVVVLFSFFSPWRNKTWHPVLLPLFIFLFLNFFFFFVFLGPHPWHM